MATLITSKCTGIAPSFIRATHPLRKNGDIWRATPIRQHPTSTSGARIDDTPHAHGLLGHCIFTFGFSFSGIVSFCYLSAPSFLPTSAAEIRPPTLFRSIDQPCLTNVQDGEASP